MARYIFATALAVLLALISSVDVRAQGEGDTLAEDTFWERLGQTATLLDQALVQPGSEHNVAPILSLWAGVQHVRLRAPIDDQAIIDVDMRWITVPVNAGDTASLQSVKRQVAALLDYHKLYGGGLSKASLATLNRILSDSRFQYSEPSPTPTPTPIPENSNSGNNFWLPTLPVGLAQALLGILGVMVVFVVVAYFLRMARTGSATLELPVASPDDPVTAQNALNLASNRAASRDYRSAIRYLYLSSLLRLDERGVIHYNATLTNREHLAQITDKPQIADLLRQIVSTFEDAWYGYIPVDETTYQAYQQRIQRLWQMVT